jgi:hypothetical protein
MKALWWPHDLKHVRCGALLALIAALSGCGTSAFPPPVKIDFRDSWVGNGKVIKITNTSTNHLYNVKVVIRNLKQGSIASVRAAEHLSPDSTVEVGWLELERWRPDPGEIVEVRCDEYALPKTAEIPK